MTPTAPFIVLEGLDGAGTTTQCQRLSDVLSHQGVTTVRTNEPTDGPIGRIIRKSLRREPGAPALTALPWMFAADRSDHLSRLVEPSLTKGSWVISDRYFHSSLAYQSLTLPLEQVWTLNQHFRTPDQTIFIRISVDTALERIAARGAERDVFEDRERLTQIAAAYDRVLDFLRELGHPIAEVDGSLPIADVTAAIREHLPWPNSST